MRLSEEVQYGPPEVYGRVVALEGVHGMVSSYVRARKKGATLRAVSSQIESVRRAGASEEEIRSKVRQGIIDPPNAVPERVKEVERHFLQRASSAAEVVVG